MKQLLTGNEAVVQGAYEAGVTYACAYPGTPSTEILENIAAYKEEITAEWAPNEKTALESSIGACYAGARSLAAMKMVGVNVAADPLFSFSYSGVNGGLVLVSADDPGMHSSQNEQDNRYYAKFAKLAMLEPSNSQECRDMIKAAYEISEKFNTPILFRMTTRVSHSKSLVEAGERTPIEKKPYVKNLQKYDLVPAVSRVLHRKVEERLKDLEQFSNETDINFIEWNDKAIGIISSGVAYEYAREVFGNSASYLKLGFTYPLPMEKIQQFAAQVKTLYVIEELEPYLEEQIKAAGIACIGKEKIPVLGELTPDIIAKVLLNKENSLIAYDDSSVANRPPSLCAGCPHRGFFYALAKRKNIMISGDIGCYGLGGAEPLLAKDMSVCMGASISVGHGAQQTFTKFQDKYRVVATIGDSTFFHTGVNSLMHIAYNQSKTVTCILDNRITGMTGHQENPGTGYTLQGKPTKIVDIPELCKAIGIEHIRIINPNDLTEVNDALDWALSLDEPSVIITRWPCVLKKHSTEDKSEFGDYRTNCDVDLNKCIGCKACIKTGCPALRFDKPIKKVKIDSAQCIGCGVCQQVCPVKAIAKVAK
ncbi:indolepyruvate ferredoxin oxidoreductase alpha subunit [Sporomusaceae bacterium BoRhaA]|uniref:indolepyruvate ferredoxin oxidoreductase subunit alpha n=1 Tax=Pelorhabdus rhamnosifermentans TaxID=2772457 RepID=UPI001C05F20F|nr:indolepyruvate ferredoxin oxidoreductase subunit alpha [Pelorhabdus rhamnosifermentans]MBU2699601.1 indolepyruvate ferredoxin oxidoreductase alpha subunit [Pelorhabdus rhamnosifermentans]